MPGETVDAVITEKKKDFARAEVLKVSEASAARVTAPCPYFGECGGCNWQHISVEDQLSIKKELLESNFTRALKTPIEFSVVSSPKSFHYRNRTQFHADLSRVGFFKKQSHELVDVQSCLISDERINQKLTEIRKQRLPQRFEIFLDSNGSTQMSATEYGGSGQGFGQVNTEVNLLLKKQIIDWVKEVAPRTIIEMYSGNGNLSFPLIELDSVETYQSLESFPESVESARSTWEKKLAQNPKLSIKKVHFHLGAAEFRGPVVMRKGADLLLVDPPRAGLDKAVVDSILESNIKDIIYVSCDPSTLIRDVRLLSHSYSIKHAMAFDMFPQTSHVESLLWLSKT